MDNIKKAKQYQIISSNVLEDPLFNCGFGALVLSGTVSRLTTQTPETKVLSETIMMAGGAIMAASYLINRLTDNDKKWIEKTEAQPQAPDHINR